MCTVLSLFFAVIIDVTIVICLLGALEGYETEWLDVLFPVIAINLVSVGLLFLLVHALEWFVVLPVFAATVFILMLKCQMRLHSAVITSIVLLAAKLACMAAALGQVHLN